MLEQDQQADENDDEKYETVEMIDATNNIQTIALNGSSEAGSGEGGEVTERINAFDFDEKLIAQEAAEPMLIKSLRPNDQIIIYDSYNENSNTLFQTSGNQSSRANTKKRLINTAGAIGRRAKGGGGGFRPHQNSQRNLRLMSSNDVGAGSNNG